MSFVSFLSVDMGFISSILRSNEEKSAKGFFFVKRLLLLVVGSDGVTFLLIYVSYLADAPYSLPAADTFKILGKLTWFVFALVVYFSWLKFEEKIN